MDYKKLLETFNKMLSKGNLYNIVIVFLVGVLILIVTNFFNSSKTATKPTMAVNENEVLVTEQYMKDYETKRKDELKIMLSKMKGVGQVEVMISFEGGEELVPAVNINDGINNTNEKDNEGGERQTTQTNKGSQVVMTTKDGSSTPVILKKYNPKVIGVLVTAEGAQDKEVQVNVKNAVGTLFGIQTSKVNVYPMK